MKPTRTKRSDGTQQHTYNDFLPMNRSDGTKKIQTYNTNAQRLYKRTKDRPMPNSITKGTSMPFDCALDKRGNRR